MTNKAVKYHWEHRKTIDVPVDDNVYCMQDRYGLPYVTEDEDGNVTTSIVEDVQTYITDNEVRAKLNVRIMYNKLIKAEIKTPNRSDEGFIWEPSLRWGIEWNSNKNKYINDVYKHCLKKGLLDSEDTGISMRYTTYPNNVPTENTSSDSTIPYVWFSPSYTSNRNGDAILPTNVFRNNYKPFLTKDITTDCTTSHGNYLQTNTWTYTDPVRSVYNAHSIYWEGRGNLPEPGVLAKDLLKEVIQARMAPAAIIRSTSLGKTNDPRELRARQTLRMMIGEQEYAKYSVRGFVSIRGESGRNYQIFPGHRRTAVYQDGRKIEELCIVLSGEFPPTDSVIMRILLVQENEKKFSQISNVFPSHDTKKYNITRPSDSRSLIEIFSDIKNNNYALAS